jgi:hypothetical protein
MLHYSSRNFTESNHRRRNASVGIRKVKRWSPHIATGREQRKFEPDVQELLLSFLTLLESREGGRLLLGRALHCSGFESA